MDYYNFNPNFADSLNLFGPSTQRALVNNCTKVLPYECLTHTDKTQWLRYCPSTNTYNRERSSTSLFLEKTVRQQSPHLNNYYRAPSFVQSTRLRQEESDTDRPLVQITVIPKSSTKVRKRRPGSRPIQHASSNQDKSIKANNVYFVVAGKRQKVIKIKTSESAELSGSSQTYNKHEESAIIERNLNQLLNSLEMEKKKKAKRKKEEEDEELNNQVSIGSVVDILDNPDVTCLCTDGVNVNPRKSRVRISGRLGLTEDDKYVLKCAATVDDKPIAMNYTLDSSRYNGGTPCIECKEGNAGARKSYNRVFCQREANVQTNMLRTEEQSYNNYCQASNCPAFTYNSYRSVETQCSPCSFNSVYFSNTERMRLSSNRDQIVQCNCSSYPTNSVIARAEYSTEFSPPKGGGNPLVVISVYQKRESSEAIPATKSPPNEECSISNEGSIITTAKKVKGGKKKDDGDKTLRSRSPSPAKGKGGKKGEDKKGKEKKPAKKGELKKKSEQKKPLVSTSTNTDNIPVPKKSIFDFKVQSSPQVRASAINWGTAAKIDAPNNVAINLDNDKESYNVLVYQSSVSTDLHISKRVKEQSSEGSVRDDSLENLLINSDDELSRKITFPQSLLLNDQTNADVGLAWTTAKQGFKVRDSLEVSHRREEQISHSRQNLKIVTSTCTSAKSEGCQQCVKAKHFRGDDCKISNPVERDKEIRELLGVRWKKSPNKSAPEVHIHEATTKPAEDSLLNHEIRSNKPEVENRKNNQTVCNAYDVTTTLLCQNTPVQKKYFGQQTTPQTSQSKVEWIYKRVQCPYLADPTEKPPSDDMIIVEPRISQMHLYKQFFSKRYLDRSQNDSPQTSKQKPIILSRRHYAKLKRVIEINAVKKARLIDSFYKRKTMCYTLSHNRDVKMKKTQEKQKFKQVNRVSEQTQTTKHLVPKDKTDKTVNRKHNYKNQFTIIDKLKDEHKDKVLKQHKKGDKEALFDSVVTKKAHSQPTKEYSGYKRHRNEFVSGNKNYYCERQQHPEIFMVTEHTRHSASSTRLHYSSLTFMRKITFSATHVPIKNHHSRKHYPKPTSVPPEPPPNVEFKNDYSNSLHTIFKGHKKRSPTPNLGTSECSLHSESNKGEELESAESQQRKPFLRRLMSCLVMRSKLSGTKIAKRKPNEIVSGESSVDTYHISSSFGAIEMSSSIYDTATSFYSNHSIHQNGSKMKRGFLNSVKEYLTIRK